jgi:poly(A) polymerase/tRNA nucleotidyltransferase (CCA-adding enzyme)
VSFLAGVDEVWAAVPEARIVGGAVRDRIAGRSVADVDFASPLMPEAVMARLGAAGIKAVPTGVAHGTVTAAVGGRGFEITTLRRDVATDGRHAMDRAEIIYDYFGGRADLAAGVVRFVGEAGKRIGEDYLRILRFFRFFARYARAPDADAVAAIEAMRDGILALSAERVWGELKRIFLADDPLAALALMERTGVLALTVPEAAGLAEVAALLGRGAPVDPLLRVAALLGGNVAAFAARLKLSNEEAARLAAMSAPFALRPEAVDADVRRALADAPAEVLVARSWLAQDEGSGWDELRDRLGGMARPVFPLQGRDLAGLGIPAGPRMGKILAAVRQWWIDGGCVADLAACRDQAMLAVVR